MGAPGYWVALSGAPSPDANMALVDSSKPGAMAAALAPRWSTRAIRPCSCSPAAPGRLSSDRAGPPRRGDGLHDRQPPNRRARLRPRLRAPGPDDAEAFAGLLGGALHSAGRLPRSCRCLSCLTSPCDDLALGRRWHPRLHRAHLRSSTTPSACGAWRHRRHSPAAATHGHFSEMFSPKRAKRAPASGSSEPRRRGKPLYEATGWAELESWRILTNADSAQFAE